MPLKHTYSVISTFFLNKFFINFSPFPSLNNPSPKSSLKNYDFLPLPFQKVRNLAVYALSLSALLFAMPCTITNFNSLTSPNASLQNFSKKLHSSPLPFKSLKSCCLRLSLSALLFAMAQYHTNFNSLTSTNAPCKTFLQKSFCHFHFKKVRIPFMFLPLYIFCPTRKIPKISA